MKKHTRHYLPGLALITAVGLVLLLRSSANEALAQFNASVSPGSIRVRAVLAGAESGALTDSDYTLVGVPDLTSPALLSTAQHSELFKGCDDRHWQCIGPWVGISDLPSGTALQSSILLSPSVDQKVQALFQSAMTLCAARLDQRDGAHVHNHTRVVCVDRSQPLLYFHSVDL